MPFIWEYTLVPHDCMESNFATLISKKFYLEKHYHYHGMGVTTHMHSYFITEIDYT